MGKRSFLESIASLSKWRGDKTLTLAAPAAAQQTLAPGERWKEFRILAKLGQGAFGSVYHARDALDREIALKILEGPEAIREGKLLAQLHHPNIVSVYSYEQTGDGAALAMELIQGQSLQNFATERGQLDPAYAALICLSLCRGLAYVHGKGLIHRDVKAGNVMRQADGRVVLVDFGLGQRLDPENTRGEIAGTLPYMAPELFEGSPASAKTDLYAAGVLLFFLVSLRYPVSATSAAGFRAAHKANRRDHLLDLRPDLPPSFIALVENAIDPDSNKRFKTAGAMASALEQVVANTSRRPVPYRWIVTAAVLLLSAIAFWQYGRTAADLPPALELVRLTTEEALSSSPSLSADGSLLAYLSDEAEPGNLDVWVRQIPNGAALRLTKDPRDEADPAISPDGHWIAYRSEAGGSGGGAYVMPAFGGEPRLIAAGASMPRFSPDGRFIAYFTGERYHPSLPSGKLFVVAASGGAPKQLAAQLADARYPVWAPDSRHILFQGSADAKLPPDQGAEWWITALDGSAPANTGAMGAFQSQHLELHPYAAFWSGEYLVFSAARNANVNLWRAPFRIGRTPGEAQRLTFGTGFETSPWLSTGGRLVFESDLGKLHIWKMNTEPRDSPPVRITKSSELDAFPSVSRDGKWLAFTRTSSEAGVRQIWMRELSSGTETMLTGAGVQKSNPILHPGGDSIVYNVPGTTGTEIHMLDRHTRATRRVCERCGFVSAWTSSGGAIVASDADGIVQVDPGSGAITRLLSKPGMILDEAEPSPDGKLLAFSAHAPNAERQVYLTQAGGTGAWRRIGEGSGWSDKPHWAADGKTLYFYSNSDGFQCIWSQRIDALSGQPQGSAQKAAEFHNTRLSPAHISQPVRGFSVSGGLIFLDLAENSASLWMSTGTRK